MAHAHTHSEAEGAYFLDQLCTVAICGALGGVAVMMWKYNMLRFILAPGFWSPVLYGGVALLLLVAVRAVALWQVAGKARADNHNHDPAHDHEHDHAHAGDHAHAPGETCDHDHAHGHDHNHDHAHGHGHSHGHGHGHGHGHDDHEHGWTPWRYAVLLLPVVLYFLNLPNQGFSNERMNRELQPQELIGVSEGVKKKGGAAIRLKFRDLANAAVWKKSRDFYEGRTIILTGMYHPLSDKEFTLFRMKMTCCAADSIPLKARIISPEPIERFQMRDWVQVEGTLQFLKVAGQDEWMPVIRIDSPNQIQPTEPSSEYET